jgi:MOSC domain-containing protein
VQACVRAIHVAPVKSLRLTAVEHARLDESGIGFDRRFVLIDDDDRAVTMKLTGQLARAVALHDAETGSLSLSIDGRPPLTGTARPGSSQSLQMWAGRRHGRLIDGPWSQALSDLAGKRLRLVLLDEDATGLDMHPVSLLSAESCAELGAHNGGGTPDPRRFRPTLLIEGVEPHEEDSWIGRDVAAGEAVLRVVERDPRCAITTRNPETGERDLDTLRMIASYRPPSQGKVWFGVYATVVRPGEVHVGDAVNPLPEDRP